MSTVSVYNRSLLLDMVTSDTEYQHDLSTRFRKYERVEVKSRKYALGTILQQNDETGACTVILDKRGELIHNILPTQIVVKHTEKWPSHNFGDRVQLK